MYFLFHSFVLGVQFFVFIYFLCQLPVCTCYIYLHIVYILFACNLCRYLYFLVCRTYRLVASGFIFWVFGHIRLVSFLVYFTSSFFSTFHFGRCNLFYAHLCVYNFVIFSYCVQQCVMTACSSI